MLRHIAVAAGAAAVVLGLVIAATGQQFGANVQPVLNQGFQAVAVTPADNAVLARTPTRALFIGAAAACNIALILQGDSAAVTWSNVQSGQFLPLEVQVVMATNTTCTNIIAIY